MLLKIFTISVISEILTYKITKLENFKLII